jgi:hypothetical protein
MKKISIFLLSVLLSTLFLSNLVVAQAEWFDVDYLWGDVFGLPSDWLQPRMFLFNFLLPFIALMAICLGMLRSLRIFPRSPNLEILIAFVMAFMTLPSRGFISFVQVSLAFAGGWAYFWFLVMFMGGSALFSVGFLHREAGTMAMYSAYRKDVGRLDTEIHYTIQRMIQLRNDISSGAGNAGDLQTRLTTLDTHLRELQARKAALRDSYSGG